MLVFSLILSFVGATPETTDFDLYHPLRHNYLVKTTMLGGGNFANKLAPGYIYVWNGVKPRCKLKSTMDKAINNRVNWLRSLVRGKINIDLEEVTSILPKKSQVDLIPDEAKKYDQLELENNLGPVVDGLFQHIRDGRDICQFWSNEEPADTSARVQLQKKIDPKTLKYPNQMKKDRKFFMTATQIEAFKELNDNTPIHHLLADQYVNRRYVKRDCANLLKIMPSYIDCIDGRNLPTVPGQKGVKYTGDATLSDNYRGNHKMARLKKHPVSLYFNKDEYKAMTGKYGRDLKPNFSNYVKNERKPNYGGVISMLMTEGDKRKELIPATFPKDHGSAIQNIDRMRLRGMPTELLSPALNKVNWNKFEALRYNSDTQLAVREWSPRTQMVGTGGLNPYFRSQKVNKDLYPVLHGRSMPQFRLLGIKYRIDDDARAGILSDNEYPRRTGKVDNKWYDAKKFSLSAGQKSIIGATTNVMKGPKDWAQRTDHGTKFVYTYSAGCWTKLRPDNYGYDIPRANFTDVSKAKRQAAKREHAQRRAKGLKPRYTYNKALQKWWNEEYGERNYFSLEDAITQNRCNGDEMLWYLFYSKPSKMDEFCTNTVFGNKIPADFCKLNPPKYFNFTVTDVNRKFENNVGKDLTYRPDWHKATFGENFIFAGFASKNNPDVWNFVQTDSVTTLYASLVLMMLTFI